MENLAFENYKSFIETAGCVRDVNEKIVSINSDVVRNFIKCASHFYTILQIFLKPIYNIYKLLLNLSIDYF
jgi:hypothetical protein